MSSYDELFQNKAFECLDKDKIGVLKTVAEKSKGKSAIEVIELFNHYGPELTKGKPLTEQEKAAMIEVIKINLSQQEKKQLDKVMSMMKMMGKGF